MKDWTTLDKCFAVAFIISMLGAGWAGHRASERDAWYWDAAQREADAAYKAAKERAAKGEPLRGTCDGV